MIQETKLERVVVGSQNPVKLRSVECAFKNLFPNRRFEIKGVAVASGVSDQPMTDGETLQGALNRVENSRQLETNFVDYYCAIEGGCEVDQTRGVLTCFAWAVVTDGKKQGRSRTATFDLPPAVADLVNGGMELGHATDQVFNLSNSKQKGGAVAALSDGLITRQTYYEHCLCLALVPFKQDDQLYPATFPLQESTNSL